MTLTQINRAGLDADALDRVFTIGASGSSAYTFQGEGLNGTVNNPTLYLTRGKTYRFENGSGGHPIRIQSTSGASGTAYNTGVTNNAGSGTVIVEVQHDAPDVLYYQCTSHAAMNGILYIVGALADGGVTTAKLANDAVTMAKIANGAVGTNQIADGTITNADINASAAIAGSKILPTFTSNVEISNSYPSLVITDTNHNSDYRITNNDGQLIIFDSTNGAHRLNVNADGHIDILGNLDVGAGIDVTGNANISGEVIAGDLAVDGTTLMVDAANNRVGLGLSNPATPLHVYSSTVNGVATFESGDTYGGIALKDNNTVNPVYLLAEGNNFKIDVNASESLRIDNNRHLGLGISSPTQRLHVYHPTTNQVARFESGDTDVSVSFKDNATTQPPTIGAAGNTLKLASNSQDRIYLDSNGHLGINQVSKDNGNVPLLVHHPTTNESIRCSSGDEYVHIGFKDSTTNNVPYLGAQGNELRFVTGGAERLRINNNGHITMASQPCAVVTNATTAGSLNNSQNGVARTFTSTHISQGGMSISNTRSRITVPTSGTYLINILLSGGISTVEAGDGIILRLRRNGANYPTDAAHPVETFGSTTGMEWAFNWSLPVNLSANDYVEVCLDNIGGTVSFGIDRGYFAVNLLH